MRNLNIAESLRDHDQVKRPASRANGCARPRGTNSSRGDLLAAPLRRHQERRGLKRGKCPTPSAFRGGAQVPGDPGPRSVGVIGDVDR
eukprot:CAMPEP_0170404310 /NCGR_PEP_ID=MMETSP0117_2-20130122/26564_1 /TAXON_ID=400756 /ORGANISM="Durinskia baltica, Strain CSIRO CS-38" /LENGTH=87 /DNA_ID=CAMNT_0010661319 /DNA_START=36 /DNA_END=299 /DNA_ORIENTATION=+